MQTNNKRQIRLMQTLLLTAMFAGAYYLDAPSPTTLTKPTTAAYPNLVNYRSPDTTVEDMPDFASIHDVGQKKQTFFDFLQPYIDAKNAEVRQQRRRLQYLTSKIKLGARLRQDENVFLWELARHYDVQTDDIHDPGFLDRLLRRVDVLPPSLVLAQAANESAWGTSRFAQEGNNLFGQWCYTQGCGLVPVRRRADANHEVKSFPSIEESVNAYFQNLNTFPSYQGMRVIRQELRQGAKPIDGISLTQGLTEYSERGDAYIQDLQAMIYKNNLLARDKTLYP
ncbi:MAG: glucosaminidase domain-containing protein [Pseudomonadota bacterium]